MSQLTVMKSLLSEEVSPVSSDEILQFYLDNARDIICDIRNADGVETQYLNTQIKIAIELYNKQGVEGQTMHTENGISRAYDKSNVSDSLIREITPFVRTPYSTVRSVASAEL